MGPADRFRAYRLRSLLAEVESDSHLRERLVALAREMIRLAATQDCLTVEVNPLVLTPEDELIAVDAKIVLDEAAAFRSARIAGAVELLQEREEASDRPRLLIALREHILTGWNEFRRSQLFSQVEQYVGGERDPSRVERRSDPAA